MHLPVEFYPDRTIRDRVMKSYPFFKTAATASQFYFRFRFSWVRSFGKVEIYVHILGRFMTSYPLIKMARTTE